MKRTRHSSAQWPLSAPGPALLFTPGSSWSCGECCDPRSIEEDFFTKLVKINFRYIDQYYYQTQQQANKSFRLSAVAATVGFGIVIVGIVMMFWGIAQPAYVTTAVGLISEFVSAVFFYLYNRTILKMGEYHEKLVLTQNISVALKIAEGLPEKARIQSQQTLIERLTQDVNLYLSDNPVIPEAK